MSISTPGGPQRRPTVVSTGKKPAAGRPAADAKPTAAKAGSGKPQRAGGGKGPRKPVTPVKVSQGRPWGPIAMFVAVGVLATAIIGFGAWATFKGSQSWEDKAAEIDGIVNYRETDPEGISYESHQSGPIEYKYSPPVGGAHNNAWQRCLGDVYDAPIASEHAVHSMEHGAVWLTYRPDLPAAEVERLAGLIRNNDFMLMSPYEGLDAAVSVQAWGYQLKVDSSDDPRIEQFTTTLAQNASIEPGVPCSSGNYTTGTGTEPRELAPPTGG